MGYYDEARNAGISQGYSLACEKLSNLFKTLKDTGRRQFTIDDINVILNELKDSCVAAPEGNRDLTAKE